jgi:hypothetical protein
MGLQVLTSSLQLNKYTNNGKNAMKTTDFINKYAESAEKYEYDDEVGMVKNNLHTIVRVLTHLGKDIGEHEDFPEWVQEKIAMIKQTSVEVMNYMISQHEMGHKPEVPGFDADIAERMFAESLNEDASAGSTCSPTIAVSMENLGTTPTEMIKRQKAYTNQLTKGGPVKMKKAK